jgi:hypothetical protein
LAPPHFMARLVFMPLVFSLHFWRLGCWHRANDNMS